MDERAIDPGDESANAITAHDLPGIRKTLIEGWGPDGFHRRSTGAVQASGLVTGSGAAGVEDRWLREAHLWWVSPDTCRTVHAAADSYPDDVVLSPEWLPSRSGLAVWSLPFWGTDAEAPEYGVRVDAILWGEVPIGSSDPSRPPIHGVAICSYRWFDTVGQMLPLGRADWPYGHRIDAQSFPDDPLPPANLASVIEDRRVLATLCSLTEADRLVVVENEPLPRAERRRRERDADKTGIDVDTIRVRNLRLRREVAADTSAGAGDDSYYQHRFLVAGHWRNQAYGPGRQLRRPMWIHTYEKGPEGAPMLDPDGKVTRL